jgi:hypothetical protein
MTKGTEGGYNGAFQKARIVNPLWHHFSIISYCSFRSILQSVSAVSNAERERLRARPRANEPNAAQLIGQGDTYRCARVRMNMCACVRSCVG